MNYTSLLLSLTAFSVTILPVARAQLVHIKFSDPDNITIFHADTANIPLDRAAGPMSQLDVFYNPNSAFWDSSNNQWVVPAGGSNFWRARYDIGGIGTFVVARPFDRLTLSWNEIDFQYLNYQSTFETMEFRAVFTEGILGPGPFPAWPMPPQVPDSEFNSSYFFFDAVGSYFGVPHLNEGYAYGSFRTATMYPIPEPSAYAAAAAALLLAACVVRRRRRTGLA